MSKIATEKPKTINTSVSELSSELSKFKTQYDAMLSLLKQNSNLLTENNEMLANFNNSSNNSSDDSSNINWDEINENLDTLINDYNDLTNTLKSIMNIYSFDTNVIYKVYEGNSVSEYSIIAKITKKMPTIDGRIIITNEETGETEQTATFDCTNTYTVLSNDNDTIIILNFNPGTEAEYDVYTADENYVFTKTNRVVYNITIKEEDDSNNTENPSTPVNPETPVTPKL